MCNRQPLKISCHLVTVFDIWSEFIVASVPRDATLSATFTLPPPHSCEWQILDPLYRRHILKERESASHPLVNEFCYATINER